MTYQIRKSLQKNRLFTILAILCCLVLTIAVSASPVARAQSEPEDGRRVFVPMIVHPDAPSSASAQQSVNDSSQNATSQDDASQEDASPQMTKSQEGTYIDGVFYAQGHDDEYLAKLAADQEPGQPAPRRLQAAAVDNVGGQWGPVIQWPHIAVSMANLPDGRILTYSGSERRSWPGTEQSYTATWDPVTGTFAEYFNDNHNMFCSDLVSTDDGRVFVLGGRNTVTFTSVFDASTNSWARLEDMSSRRWYPSSMSLAEGGVFTLAGKGGPYPEVWTEGEGWRQLTGANIQSAILDYGVNKDGAGWWPLVHQDPRGNILHYGATPEMHSIDPRGDGAITSLGNSNLDWYPEENIAIMYDEGKILVAGGAQNSSSNTSSNKAASLDISGTTPSITTVANMNFARQFGNEVVLPNGHVLVIGGNTTGQKFSDNAAVMEPEAWDPATNTWTLMNPMAVPRIYHSTAILLPDARVLTAGGGYGGDGSASWNHQDGQVFSPPYLFTSSGALAARPAINDAPDVIAAGEIFSVNTSEAIQKFTMVRMSATTHTMNTGQRFLNVPFTGANNSYQLTANRNINVILPGYWMLYAINNNGVPSVAKIIQVVRSAEDNLAVDGTATQSSVGWGGTPERAIDGNPGGIYTDGSISHTLNDSNSWWEIDLKNLAEIDSIKLWGRSDCCADRLSNFYILISDVPFVSQDLEETRNQNDVGEIYVPSQVNGQQEFTVGRTGRYVRIQRAGSGYLQLAEAQIFGRQKRDINYEYFHGTWNILPDFSNPPPPLVKSGTVDTFTIQPREQDDNFGFHFEGTLSVPSAGTYTFYTRSDDGTKLWINNQLVVINDGTHGMVEKSGTIALSAGQHTIRVDYFELGGGQGLEVHYAGPGIAKQLIPASALSQLTYEYYHGSWSALPDFASFVPVEKVKSGTVDTFTLEPRERDDYFGFSYNGTVYLPTDGTYTFFTRSDDGTKLWINDQLIVSNDGRHAMRESSGTVPLTAGIHKIQVDFFENNGSAGLEVSYAGPGIPKQIIPASALSFYRVFPQLEAVESQTNLVGDAINLSMSATEPQGQPLTYSASDLPPGLSINSSGTIQGTITTNSIGSYKVELTASDPDGNYDTAEFNWIVSNVPNCEPLDFSAYAVQSIAGYQDQGEYEVLDNGATLKVYDNAWKVLLQPYSITPNLMLEFDFKSTIQGEEHSVGFGTPLEPLGYRFALYGTQNHSPEVTTVNSDFRNYAGNGAYQHYVIPVGQFLNDDRSTLYFNADHDASPFNGNSFFSNVTIYEAGSCNTAPSITNPGAQNSTVGDVIDFNLTAEDEDGDTITFSAANLPSGLSILPESGAISGMVDAAGSSEVLATVEDSNGATDSTTFTWTVVDPPLIVIDDISTTPQSTGVAINYTASASGGNGLLYSWLFGDDTPPTEPSTSPSIAHTYSTPGRYLAQLTVTDAAGQEESHQFYQAIYTPLSSAQPTNSSSIIYEARSGNDRIWNVNPDNDTVTVYDIVTNSKLAEIGVGKGPRSLALAAGGSVWVANKHDASLTKVDANSLSVAATVALQSGSQPYGVAADLSGGHIYVALESTGRLLKLNASNGSEVTNLAVGGDIRHVAVRGDGNRVYVSRFITPKLAGEETAAIQVNSGGGEVVVVNPATMSIVNTVQLQVNNNSDFEAGARGVPNYLGAPVISPDGTSAWIPSKQDNLLRGGLRDGEALNFEHTVRAISSKIDLGSDAEIYGDRIDHDNSSLASAAAFGPYGNYLFVALETSREVGILDVYSGQELIRIEVGRAPQGLAVSADGTKLFVHNFMDRAIGVYDLTDLIANGNLSLPNLTTYNTVASEQLAASILSGKQIFYDAADLRLTKDSYMSCASCHNDGGHDGRIWDFTDRGEGLRNTISLNGHGGPEHGRLHWSANFDEIHDFENQIRALGGGTGLMDDIDFNTASDPLGVTKAGLSSDLDALATYVNSLTTVGVSPNRAANGELTPDGAAGRVVFIQQNCASCHSGTAFTDSATDALHDIGTIQASSGQRSGGALSGIDTPSLRGIWATAPYLHDGAATTVAEAVQAHSNVSVTAAELDNLVAYLLQIDDSELTAPANDAPIIEPVDPQVNIVGDSVNLTIAATDPNNDTLTFSATGLPDGLSINASSGAISGAVSTVSTYNPTITVSDGNGGVDSVTIGWAVDEPINNPPTADAGVDQTITDLDNDGFENVSLDGAASTDSDGLIATYEWSGVNDVVIPNGPSPAITLPMGSHVITLLVTDDDGATATDTVNITIEERPNTAPILDDIAEQQNEIGDTVGVSIVATDADNDALTYSAANLPFGLAIDPATGGITGSPTTANTYNVTLTVSDGNGGTDSATFEWIVTPPTNIEPVANAGADQSLMDSDFDGLLTVTLDGSASTDDDGAITSYAWSGVNGVSIPDGPTPTVDLPVGSHTIILTIIDNDGATATDNVNITINAPINSAPVLNAIPALSSLTGDTVNVSVTATDTENHTLTYSATNLPAGVSIDPSTGNLTGSPTAAGSNTVTITVIDGNGGTDSTNFIWTVAQPTAGCGPLEQEAENGQFSGLFEVQNDANASGGSYVTVSDTVLNVWNGPDGINRVSFCATVAEEGLYRIATTSAAGGTLADSFYVQINDEPAAGYLWDAPQSLAFASGYVGDRGGMNPVELSLQPGDHTITFYLRESGTKLDKIALEKIETIDLTGDSCAGLVREAEEGILSGDFAIVADAGASGGQYIHVPDGNGTEWGGPNSTRKVDYCFTVTDAGIYTIEGMVAGDDDLSDSFYVRVNDAPQSAYLWDTARTSSFIPAPVSDREGQNPVTLSLNPGIHTVTIYAREDGSKLDKLSLVPQNAGPSVTQDCSGLQREAEDGLLSGGFIVGSDTAASGGQYIHVPDGGGNEWNGPNEQRRADFCFTVAEAGTYQLKAGVFGADDLADSFYVRVNDTPAAGYLWDTTRNIGYLDDYMSSRNGADPVLLTLTPGQHNISIYLREDGTRIDHLALEEATLAAAERTEGTRRTKAVGLVGTIRVQSEVSLLETNADDVDFSQFFITVIDRQTLGERTYQTVSVNADGTYRFDNLSEGEYLLTLRVPAGYISTLPENVSVIATRDSLVNVSPDVIMLQTIQYNYLPLLLTD